MRRVTALLVILGVMWIVALATAVTWTFRATNREEALRHEIVAGRMFDEMEQELTDLVRAEEARSFLEYRFFYVPDRQVPGEASRARSPLSEAPLDPSVVGWFQVEPDGRITFPRRPRPDEERVARTLGWSPDPAEDTREALLTRLWETNHAPILAQRTEAPPSHPAAGTKTESIPTVAQAKTESIPTVAQAKTESTRNDLLNSLSRAVQRRSYTESQNVVSQAQNIESFRETPKVAPEGEPPKVAPNPETPKTAPKKASARVRPLQAGDAVDVELSRFEGSAPDDDHLLLVRTVRIGRDTWQQGLVLDKARLAARLGSTVLEASPLAPTTSLAWTGRSSGKKYSFDHRFAPPFQELAVQVGLDTLASETVPGRGLAVGLALVLVLAGFVGALALHRLVAVRLEYAARRNDFVAAVSHELKTPLTSIRMLSEMLRDGMVPDPDRQRQYHATLTSEAERLSRLVANVLELSRLERGTRAMSLQTEPVGVVLAQAAEALGPHLQELGFTLQIQAPDDLVATFDPDALVQVLTNLLDNAAKFSRDATDRRITLAGTTREGRTVLTVRDHGPGVPQGQMRRIFEPFYRGERELTRRTRGTGIGLALVDGLVQRMGGRVFAHNLPDGGFEVGVELAGR